MSKIDIAEKLKETIDTLLYGGSTDPNWDCCMASANLIVIAQQLGYDKNIYDNFLETLRSDGNIYNKDFLKLADFDETNI